MKTLNTALLILSLSLSTITYSQSTPQDFFNKGLEAFYGGQFQDGVNFFDTYIKSMPTDFEGYRYRGLCYQGMKNYPRSIEDFANAIRISPNNSDGYLNRGNSYYLSKNYSSATRDYKDALRLNPNDIEAYFGMARIYNESRKFNDALKELNHAEGIDPMNARVYLNKSFIHMQLLDTVDMFNDVATAMYYDSNIVFTEYRRDLIYVRFDTYKKALAYVDNLVQREPGSYMYNFMRGFIYFIMNNFDFAKRDFMKAEELNKNHDEQFIKVINQINRSIDRNSN